MLPWRVFLRPAEILQGWLHSPRLTLRVSAVLGILLTPVIAGAMMEVLHRALPGPPLDPPGPLAFILFGLFAVGSLTAAGAQVWVSSRLLSDITISTFNSDEQLALLRRRFAILRLPTAGLLWLMLLNVMMLPLLAVGAVAWGLLSLILSMLWAIGAVISVGALSSAIDRAMLEQIIWFLFEIFTAPRHLFALEAAAVTALGPVLFALLLLTVVVGPVLLAATIIAERDRLRSLSSSRVETQH